MLETDTKVLILNILTGYSVTIFVLL